MALSRRNHGPYALLLWLCAASACGGEVQAECEEQGCETGETGAPVECPSVWDIHEQELCEVGNGARFCSYPDPDCPGATLSYSCTGLWQLKIEWDWPNCNSAMTCPEEPQSAGASCNVWPHIPCAYEGAGAACGAAVTELHCIDARWACAEEG